MITQRLQCSELEMVGKIPMENIVSPHRNISHQINLLQMEIIKSSIHGK